MTGYYNVLTPIETPVIIPINGPSTNPEP